MKEKVKAYLEESGIPKTLFCRRMGISTYHLYAWLKGDRNFSDELTNKVKAYLEEHTVHHL